MGIISVGYGQFVKMLITLEPYGIFGSKDHWQLLLENAYDFQ